MWFGYIICIPRTSMFFDSPALTEVFRKIVKLFNKLNKRASILIFDGKKLKLNLFSFLHIFSFPPINKKRIILV